MGKKINCSFTFEFNQLYFCAAYCVYYKRINSCKGYCEKKDIIVDSDTDSCPEFMFAH